MESDMAKFGYYKICNRYIFFICLRYKKIVAQT